MNGELRDLRLPLSDGEQIEILTSRNADDPDALLVLRHSSAHLLAEAVRRLYPDVKVAIGPAIETGFYYDFDFPEPIAEEDLARIEEEMQTRARRGKELASGRALARRGAEALRWRRTSPTRSSWSKTPRARSPSTRRETSPTSAAARI